MCYKDRTFCPHWTECKSGAGCQSALTDDIREDAKRWWDGDDAPIAMYLDKPQCFEAKC